MEDQILTPSAFFEYARTIEGITFNFISKDEMQLARQALIPRYSLASTVPGTRRYHFFEPQEYTASQCTIKYKELYIDHDFKGKHTFGVMRSVQSMPRPHEYVACIYDHNWWIGLVTEVW